MRRWRWRGWADGYGGVIVPLSRPLAPLALLSTVTMLLLVLVSVLRIHIPRSRFPFPLRVLHYRWQLVSKHAPIRVIQPVRRVAPISISISIPISIFLFFVQL